MNQCEQNVTNGDEERCTKWRQELLLETVELLDVNELCTDDSNDSWLHSPPLKKSGNDVDLSLWVRGGFAKRRSAPTRRSLLEQLDQVVKYSGWKKFSSLSTPVTHHLLNACKPDHEIDTRTFTRPKKSGRQNTCLKPNSENPSEVLSTDVKQTADELEHEQPADVLSPLCNSFEVNSRTFTRKSSLRGKKSSEAIMLPSGPNGDAVERVMRCNGGESMVMDYGADVYWLCDDVAVKDHNKQARGDYLPDMVDLQIIAKARLQEKDLRQKCGRQSLAAIMNAVHKKPITFAEMWSITCHMGSHKCYQPPVTGEVQQLRSSHALNVRKMSSPAVINSLSREDDDKSSVSDDRLSLLSFASAPTHHPGQRKQQPLSRASFSSLDQLPSTMGPSLMPKKSSPSTPKSSSIPRPNSASKFPIQRKNRSSSMARRNLVTSYQTDDNDSWREGCF